MIRVRYGSIFFLCISFYYHSCIINDASLMISFFLSSGTLHEVLSVIGGEVLLPCSSYPHHSSLTAPKVASVIFDSSFSSNAHHNFMGDDPTHLHNSLHSAAKERWLKSSQVKDRDGPHQRRPKGSSPEIDLKGVSKLHQERWSLKESEHVLGEWKNTDSLDNKMTYTDGSEDLTFLRVSKRSPAFHLLRRKKGSYDENNVWLGNKSVLIKFPPQDKSWLENGVSQKKFVTLPNHTQSRIFSPNEHRKASGFRVFPPNFNVKHQPPMMGRSHRSADPFELKNPQRTGFFQRTPGSNRRHQTQFGPNSNNGFAHKPRTFRRPSDQPILVLWYKDGLGTPIYR